MNTKSKFFLLIVLPMLAVALPTAAADPSLKQIMQGLRDDLFEIADGLLVDDFDKVADGAAGIAGHAQIPPEQIQLVAGELGAEMSTFKQFDNLVHDLSLAIAAAAEERDRDRAIENFQRMLDGCMACHAAYRERVSAALAGAGAGGPE